MSEQDLMLWNAFLDGDKEAYRRIYDMHAGDMFWFGQSLTPDKDLVKDCIQDVFVKIYSNRTRLGITENIRSYLCTALRNNILNALKKESVRRERSSVRGPGDGMHDSPEQEFISAEDRRQRKQLFARVLGTLTARQREAVYYRYVEELEISEIAEAMGMNYQSVQNLIQRSIAKAQDALQGKSGGPE